MFCSILITVDSVVYISILKKLSAKFSENYQNVSREDFLS